MIEINKLKKLGTKTRTDSYRGLVFNEIQKSGQALNVLDIMKILNAKEEDRKKITTACNNLFRDNKVNRLYHNQVANFFVENKESN